MNAKPTPHADTPDIDRPGEYVRTFSGDMETLKKGGVPDLAPLIQAPLPKERLIEASPIATTMVPPRARTFTGTPPPPPPRPTSTHLETYESDFLDAVNETKASTATVLAAEQDSLRKTQTIEKSTPSVIYVISGVIFFIAGITGAYIVYTRYLTAHAPVSSAPIVLAPIFVDDKEQISGQGLALISAINQSVARPLVVGNVRLLYSASTTTGSIFSMLPISAPDILLRNINTNGSMAGVMTVGGAQSPFFILSVSSYGNTFSGMLSWETMMSRSLSALFPAYPASSIMGGTGTTTPTIATSTPRVQMSFHDEVVGNHDVRVYRDFDGRSVLLYGYWNQTTLVIARDVSAFTEILKRLATSRAQ